MATNLTVLFNKVDADVSYETTPANYISGDLVNDYVVWTAGSAAVASGEDEPSTSELNAAATIISPSADVEVAHCLVFDKDDGLGTLREVVGMNENKRYVFGFSFDAATASEPQLEAWDDDTHTTTDNNCLGGLSGYDSFVKATVTTYNLPAWPGTSIAGSSSVLLLNAGLGGLDDVPSGQTTQELYANVRVIIPTAFPNPAFETFVLTCRYSYL